VTGKSIRVVLCDDVAELRTLMRYGLEEQPGLIVVGEAGDAATGVALVAQTLPDAVLLDLSMPGMDGLQAIPLIIEASPTTAIVVFSGFAADRMAALALEIGADRYVEKGSSLVDIRRAITLALEQRGSTPSRR